MRELRASAAGKNNEIRMHGCYQSFLAQTVKEYGYHDVTDQMEKILSHLICVILVGSYFKIEDSSNRIMTFAQCSIAIRMYKRPDSYRVTQRKATVAICSSHNDHHLKNRTQISFKSTVLNGVINKAFFQARYFQLLPGNVVL